MTFKALATYFATVVLTASLAVCGIAHTILPRVLEADRWSGAVWAFIAFIAVTLAGTLAGIFTFHDHQALQMKLAADADARQTAKRY